MSSNTRAVLAIVGGALILLLCLFWAITTMGPFSELLGYRTGLASSFKSGDEVYKRYGDLYTFLSFVGLAFVAGLSFTVFMWEKQPPRHRVHLLYWVLLSVLLPLSMMNFWSEDIYVSRSQQIWFNLAQCVLALICLVSLVSLSVRSVEAQVLRAIAVFFLAGQGFFVPALFSIIWLVNWEGMISLSGSKDFSPGWVTIISAFASLVLSVLQYRSSLAKAKIEKVDDTPRIILP